MFYRKKKNTYDLPKEEDFCRENTFLRCYKNDDLLKVFYARKIPLWSSMKKKNLNFLTSSLEQRSSIKRIPT